MEILGYFGAILTGVSLGLIGGGGSILIVPVLVYLFGVLPQLATAYSLFVVGVASVVGAIQYGRQGLIDYRTAVVFAIPAFIAVFLTRSWLLPAIPDEIATIAGFSLTKDILIMVVFAVVMLMAAYAMVRPRAKSNESDQEDESAPVQYNFKWIAVEGLGVGALTGFVGAGGGFLIIPALVLLARLPMKMAVGTSLVIIAAKSLLGFLGDIASDQLIDWQLMLTVTILAVAGIYGGAALAKLIPGKKLQPAFGWFVLVMAVYILSKQALA